MGDIIKFPPPKKKDTDGNDLYLSGMAYCIGCTHGWAAVAPIGTVWLYCPLCRFPKGRFIHPVITSEERWQCACGNQLFLVSRKGCFCINCGTWQNFGKN